MVSVIVPIYNNEKYLPRCIESIIRQAYSDIEIILVDDGSTDSSGTICDKYAAKDERISVIHTSNCGVSSARNKGLDAACGEYVYFVDSDDIISRNAIEILVALIGNYDMSFAGHAIYDTNKRLRTRWEDYSEQPHIWERDEALMLMFDCSALKGYKQKYYYIGYCYNKLFRKSILDNFNIRFDEGIHYNEDRLFVVKYISNCNRIISIPKSIYKYFPSKKNIYSKNSHMKRDWFESEMTEFDSFNKMISFLEDDVQFACIYTAYKRAVRFYLRIIWYRVNLVAKTKALINNYKNRILCNKKAYKNAYIILLHIMKSILFI